MPEYLLDDGRLCNALHSYLTSYDANLCFIAGESGQGKSTLLNRLQEEHPSQAAIYSIFDEEYDDFYKNIVRSITALIIANQEKIGYRWHYLLAASPVSLSCLIKLDMRLSAFTGGPHWLDSSRMKWALF